MCVNVSNIAVGLHEFSKTYYRFSTFTRKHKLLRHKIVVSSSDHDGEV